MGDRELVHRRDSCGTDCSAGTREGTAEILRAALVLTGVVAPVWAATRTRTLAIPSMHCAMCPVTVEEPLAKVPGVRKIEMSLAKKDAVVIFDDAKATVGALTAATRNAGYPSTDER